MNRDFSVLGKLGLALPPIGVRYDYFRPEGIAPLEAETKMSLCELMREAQRRETPFYFAKDNAETCVGKKILGMESWEPFAQSGQIGVGLGVFDEARCNGRLYQFVRHLAEGTVNFVSFARYDKLTFNPDVLIVAAPISKGELVLRAATYATGELYTSVCTPTIGCSWLFAYPYLEDKINYILPHLVHGPHGRQLYGENTMLIAIPYRWIPVVLDGLSEMPLELSGHESVEAYHAEFEGLVRDLGAKAAAQGL